LLEKDFVKNKETTHKIDKKKSRNDKGTFAKKDIYSNIILSHLEILILKI